MKFSDFDRNHWEENHRYYDTCLVPFTGLTGNESPPETAEALERLRDFMDKVEGPFKGRIVTYPAIQYAGEGREKYINSIFRKVKSSNFQYAILLTADISISEHEIIESDLVLSLPALEASQGIGINAEIAKKIQEMWQRDQ